MSDVDNKVKMIVEGCLLAAGRADSGQYHCSVREK